MTSSSSAHESIQSDSHRNEPAEAHHDSSSSLGHKIKSVLIGSKTHSEMKQPEEIRDEKHHAKSEHDRLEAQADEIMQQRDLEQAQQGVHPFEAPEVINGRPGLEQAAHHSQDSSSARGIHQGHPDLINGTHIPEIDLPQRHHEKQHTATRPSDPYDQTAMDGAVRNETSAGDDYAL